MQLRENRIRKQNKKQLFFFFLQPTGRQPPKHLKYITSAVYGPTRGIRVYSFVGSYILADRNAPTVFVFVFSANAFKL